MRSPNNSNQHKYHTGGSKNYKFWSNYFASVLWRRLSCLWTCLPGRWEMAPGCRCPEKDERLEQNKTKQKTMLCRILTVYILNALINIFNKQFYTKYLSICLKSSILNDSPLLSTAMFNWFGLCTAAHLRLLLRMEYTVLLSYLNWVDKFRCMSPVSSFIRKRFVCSFVELSADRKRQTAKWIGRFVRSTEQKDLFSGTNLSVCRLKINKHL
jgi:hypothetical protein